MNVILETKEGVILARVDETQIGAETADEFKGKILEKLPAENGRLAIDLSKVDFMDSSGLGSLVSLLKTVRPGGELVLFVLPLRRWDGERVWMEQRWTAGRRR